MTARIGSMVSIFVLVTGLALGASKAEIVLQMQLEASNAQLESTRQQLAAATRKGAQVVEATNNNRKAIESLSSQSRTAVDDVKQAASQIVDSTEATKLELARLRASLPINSTPVWLAAIAALVSLAGVIGTIVLAFINTGKLSQIHVLANGNLARISDELREAHKEIGELQAGRSRRVE